MCRNFLQLGKVATWSCSPSQNNGVSAMTIRSVTRGLGTFFAAGSNPALATDLTMTLIGHLTAQYRQQLVQRFISKVNGAYSRNECWQWEGQTTSTGRGRFLVDGASVLAARVAYVITYGEIDEGVTVYHSCNNYGCVNAHHLHVDDIQDLKVRLFSKVTTSADGCHIWNGAISSRGNGSISFRGKSITAHKAAWLVEYGTMPTSPMFHGCDNKRCVNLSHIRTATVRPEKS